MDCINVKKTLSKYQDNELDVNSREAVRLHLKICTGCKRELFEMENIISRMKTVKPVAAPLNFDHIIMSQIYEKKVKQPSFLHFKFASLIYSLVFILFLSFGFIFIDIDKPWEKDILNDNTDIYIASILADEQELGLLNIQDSIIGIIEDEVRDEN